ncbi:DUF4424 domain-containing protein [Reyranella aquatilis]|uniref:DUF4424 domain-containing protein n=1 Tax=Reyranella aquatilis TaxID=2035356 RepID=A0ABS8L0Q0_9HYPH|nr:DUF4424 family protein [Reyranella aquatilis]MCC8431863.1 DUF4424 domain-containing protein [Reyranella aquatilis]
MLLRSRATLSLATALAFVGPAGANDSSSELAAGGLVLVKTEAISMQREDLTLSPSEVRVRYEMRNDTGQPVTLRVAFPMPEVPSDTPAGMTTKSGAHNVAMRPPTDPDFLRFRVWADGREIKPEVEIKALLPDGRDIAAALQEIGGPSLVLQPGIFPSAEDKPLAPVARQKLQALGALEPLEGGDGFRLPWSVRITFHWMQTFAPGVTVVEHSYKPVIGSRFIVIEDNGKIGGSGGEDPLRAFCIDAATDQSIRAADRRVKEARRPAGADAPLLTGYTLGYILQTARNWRGGTIGTFNLTLEGGPIVVEGNTVGNVRITTLCTELPLRRTGPQRFEATVRNYVPKEDLRILYIAD